MPPVKDSFLDLERHRQMLEENTEQLNKALQEWRLWEAEYEALREDLSRCCSHEDLARIRRDFDGQLVTRKEVTEILGRTNIRPVAQISGLVDRRLEYVERNIETLEKKVRDAEEKAAVAGIISQPDGRDDDGLPITDIVEELDDNDNIISYRLQASSDTQPRVREALEKAVSIPTHSTVLSAEGAALVPPEHDASAQQLQSQEPGPVTTVSTSPATTAAAPRSTTESSRGSAQTGAQRTSHSGAGSKTVSFADDTKPGADESDESAIAQHPMRIQRRMERVMQAARDQETMASQPAILPEGESPEDAALRRDMLAYGASEIGPVVAELVLEEGEGDEEEDFDEDDEAGDDDDDDYDDDGDFDDYEDDTEDESGRSKQSYVTKAYRRRMQQLEKRLNLEFPGSSRGPTGQGDSPSASTEPQAETAARDKNRIAFADSLEVLDAAEPDSGISLASRPRGPDEAPARFLDQSPRTAPAGPEKQTIADSIVERPSAPPARAAADFDAALVHQEAAVEYHHARKKLIQKSGGFLNGDTSAVAPLDEEEGGSNRVSRFKAARLSRE